MVNRTANMSGCTANLITADLNQYKSTINYNSGQYATVTHYKRVYPHQAVPHPARIRVPLPNTSKPQGSDNWSRNQTFHLGARKTTPADFPSSSSRFKDVTGRERVKYYSRPVLPGNQSSVPLIKYAPDVSQVPDDFTAEFLARRDSYSKVRRSLSLTSVAVQTAFRDSECQTQPFTPNGFIPEGKTPDVLALQSLKHERGLPVESDFDIERVRGLRNLYHEEQGLPAQGEKRKEKQENIFTEKQRLEWEARQQDMQGVQDHREVQLDGYIKGWNRLANAKIEDRLSRLWAKKQQEKEDRFAKLRKQHEKELKLLANRSQKKVENIFRGVGKGKLDTEDILKYEYASAPTKAKRLGQMTGQIESEYLDTYNGILALERDKATISRLSLPDPEHWSRRKTPASVKGRGRGRESKDDTERRKLPAKSQSSGSLLKEYKVEKHRPTTPSVPEEYEIGVDEDQAAFLLQKTLRGRAVQLRMQKGRARKQDLINEMRVENPITEDEAKEVEERLQEVRQMKAEKDTRQAKEDFINAFLDRLEGETLGKMLDYLSCELTHSAITPKARDMMDTSGELQEHRKQEEQDHIFSEIVKVTQSTVDKYLDDILLKTIYKNAHEDTLEELGIDPDEVEKDKLQSTSADRRASTGDFQDSPTSRQCQTAKENQAVKQRMKATQKKYLSAAHDQIWGMIDQFKVKGEVVPENREEIETNIRTALGTVCDPDDVEVDLKNAVSNLDMGFQV